MTQTPVGRIFSVFYSVRCKLARRTNRSTTLCHYELRCFRERDREITKHQAIKLILDNSYFEVTNLKMYKYRRDIILDIHS